MLFKKSFFWKFDKRKSKILFFANIYFYFFWIENHVAIEKFYCAFHRFTVLWVFRFYTRNMFLTHGLSPLFIDGFWHTTQLIENRLAYKWNYRLFFWRFSPDIQKKMDSKVCCASVFVHYSSMSNSNLQKVGDYSLLSFHISFL